MSPSGQTVKSQASKKAPVGRPMSFDKEQLVQTVMNMFWEKGYSNLSLSEIAESTNLTRASLYNCFGSKEELFLEALESYRKSTPETVLDDVETVNCVGDMFYQLFDQICDTWVMGSKQSGCMVANCLNEFIAAGSPLSERLQKMLSDRKKNVRLMIIRAREKGELPETTNTTVVADMIFTFMCGLNTFSKSHVDKQELRNLCYGFLEQIGFQKKPG